MNTDRNNQGRQEESGRQLEKNETLQDAGASVPGYGRSDTGVEEREPAGQDRDREPGQLRNEETLGNP